MKKLLSIVGPTGTGKTDLGLNIAKDFDGEIVSADSRQIYQGMDIGTGKIDAEKLKGVKKEKNKWVVDNIPIHLYDVIGPDQTFSVATYQQFAYKAIEKIHRQGKLPILVGGTGLYTRAVLEGLKIPKVAPNQKLRRFLEGKSPQFLYENLARVDPQTAADIDKANKRRLIRALEIYEETGESAARLKSRFSPNFDQLRIGLTAERSFLYQKVDARVDAWMSTGFIDEVKELLSKGYKDSPGLKTMAYRQAAMYLEGHIDLAEATQRIKFEHHRLIRQQTTWFRKDSKIIWFDTKEKNFQKEIKRIAKNWLSQP